MIEEHINRFEQSFRHVNDRDWDAYRDTISAALLYRAPGIGGIMTGREPNVAALRSMVMAFPDGRAEVERSFGSDDWACFQATFTGTHTGPLRTSNEVVLPSGKPTRHRYCLVVRFGLSGEAVEIDEYHDRLDLLAQLGAGVGSRPSQHTEPESAERSRGPTV